MSGLVRRLLGIVGTPGPTPGGVLLVGACAANCGRPVYLTQAHYRVVRVVAQLGPAGVVTPAEGVDLVYAHLECWLPGRDQTVTITAIPGVPDEATLVLGGVR